LVDAHFRYHLIRPALLDCLDMAYVGPRRYVVVVIHVGGTKLSNVKLVLQREPRTGRTWFPVGSVLANEKHVDAVVRE
jgi:hypothetical protein